MKYVKLIDQGKMSILRKFCITYSLKRSSKALLKSVEQVNCEGIIGLAKYQYIISVVRLPRTQDLFVHTVPGMVFLKGKLNKLAKHYFN